MSRAHRRSAVVLALVAVLAQAVLAACGDDGGTAGATAQGTSASSGGVDLSGVTLHVGDQINLAKTLLGASGEDKDLPYKIEWSSFAAGPPLLEALNAGAIDVGSVGDAPPIFAQSSGAKVTIVAATSARVAGQSALAIVVPKDSPAQSVADLKGKKVGLAQGSAAHWLLLAALDKAGLSFGDITPAYLLPADGLAAFNGGDVDAWAIWDPFRSLGESQGGRVLTTGSGLVGGYSFQLSRPAVLADPAQTAAVGDYLQRLSRATEWSIEHRDEWIAQYAQLTKLSPEIAGKTFEHFQQQYVPLDDSIIAAQQAEADAFAAAGLIPSEIDVSQAFDTRFAGDFAPAPSTTASEAPK
jgi:sulfonate transport system substrate-binding protein